MHDRSKSCTACGLVQKKNENKYKNKYLTKTDYKQFATCKNKSASYLTIILRGRAGYQMIDNQRDA